MAKKRAPEAKPKNDAYTSMLLITFVAILVGCVLMYLDTEQYKEGPEPPSTPALVLPKLGSSTASAGGSAVTPEPAAP